MVGKIARRKHAEQTLRMLIEKYPAFAREKPLKIGIIDDLRAALPDINGTHLYRAMTLHTNTVSYRRALAQGGPRYDLDGNVAGEVDAAQIAHAAARLARLEGRFREEGERPAATSTGQTGPATPIIMSSPPSAASPPIGADPKRSSLADLREAARHRHRTEKVT